MPVLTYNDLKYKREENYIKNIEELFEVLKKENPEFSNLITESLTGFYSLLSAAIQIDDHPNVKLIKEAICKKYDTDVEMHVFLYESALPKALCTNRHYFTDGEEHSELIILVSQHFFNYLDFQQQISILSHELSHKLLGHTEIPARKILNSEFNFAKFRGLKMDLLKWSICAEISSDIFALHTTDYNPKIFSTSIIKFASGVNAIDSYDLISILENQYDQLAKNAVAAEISPHPILPLRIKIIKEVCSDQIISKMGKEVTIEEKNELVKNYNKKIDNLLLAVYPELFDNPKDNHPDLYLMMGAAVILADKVITDEEEAYFLNLNYEGVDTNSFIEKIRFRIENEGYDLLIESLISESIKYCKEHNLEMVDIIPLVRFLLLTSTLDNVNIEELRIINRFAEQFDISKEEIVLLLNQVLS